MLASADAHQYEHALRLVLADDAVDAVIVIYTDPMISEPALIIDAVRRAAVQHTAQDDVGVFPGPRSPTGDRARR